MSYEDAFRRLYAAMHERTPVVTGTIPVSADSCSIFYRNNSDESAIFINTSSATPTQLEALTAACQAATFGLGGEDVLDETYRKAGKLDNEQFATKLQNEVYSILSSALPTLYDDGDDDNGKTSRVVAELYKLNVYGEGAFFKSHKDTPRGKDMFDSLVIALPAPHTGGVLSFAHCNRTWALDSGALLGQASEPSIAYAVFFSDVDHEVLPVTSGHRITLTYNLRWRSKSESTQLTSPPSETNIRSILQELLADGDFMPDGGLLGFGLQYQYPSGAKMLGYNVLSYLKGTDAALYRACKGLGHRIKAGGVWSDEYSDDADNQWLMSSEPYFDDYANEDLSAVERVSIPISGRGADDDIIPLDDQFLWAVPLTSKTKYEQSYIHYGNNATIDTFYADICLVMNIGPAGSSTDAADLPQGYTW